MSEARRGTKTLCKYFLNGACKKGRSCEFSHDRNDVPSKVCSYYLQGSCSYGSRCRYDHVKDKNIVKAPQQLSEVNNGASSSGMQMKKKLKYKGQEFVPGQVWASPVQAPSYSAAAQAGLPEEPTITTCEFCSEIIHPEQDDHLENCLKFQEKEMEDAFKAQASSKKTCGICLDVVWDKEPDSKKRFGILSHCNHVYCLECIRKWRCKEEADTTRLCPECRTKSDFVLPSYYWFNDDDEKAKMIVAYKESLKNRPCRYFSKEQFCRFGDKCFYLHLNPDGSKGQNKRRYKEDADGLVDLISLVTLSEFLDNLDYDDDDDDDYDVDLDDDYYYCMFHDDSSTDSD